MDTSDATPPNIHSSSRRASRPKPLATRKSSNNVAPGPASPEIISSLISSLSVISSPANSLFEGPLGSQSLPASPALTGNTFGLLNGYKVEQRSSRGSFGIDYGAYLPSRTESQIDVLPDELPASPPVIRTSKPPSGLSSVTAPKRQKSRDRSPFKSFLRGSSRGSSRPSSRDSSTSKERESTGSFGGLSIDRGTSPSVELHIKKSSDSWNRPGIRGSKSLMYMSSRERLREAFQKSPTLLSSAASLDTLSLPPLAPFDSDYFMAATPISEEPSGATVEVAPAGYNYGPVSPEIGGVADGKFIPARGSSLRKSSSNKRSSRRGSRQHERRESDAGGTILEEGEQQYGKSGNIDFRRQETLSRVSSKTPEPIVAADVRSQTKYGNFQAQPDDNPPSVGPVDASPLNDLDERVVKNERNRGRRKLSIDRRSGTLTPEPLHEWPQRMSSAMKHMSAPTSPQKEKDLQHRSTWQAGSRSSVVSPEPKLRSSHTEERSTSPSDSVDDAVEAYLRSPRLSQKIQDDRTGRVISFSEVGDSEGYAVFCCVGMGLTRYITSFYDELCATLKLRLITPDRPGVGDSQPYSDGTSTPLSWPGKLFPSYHYELKLTPPLMISTLFVERSRLINSLCWLTLRVPSTLLLRLFECPNTSAPACTCLRLGFHHLR